MNKPYIGVTDFTDSDQVMQALDCIPLNINRRLHVGIMCSYKTLHGIPTSSGWEHIWPTHSQVRELFKDVPRVYNVIHYADYDDLTSLMEIQMALDYAGEHVNAIQLDMKWPSPQLLEDIKRTNPTIDIIQQIGRTAMNQSSDWEKDLAQYDALADYVLLDYGMGRGTPFASEHMLELVETALMYFGEDQIAVAGGLGPNTYRNLAPVFDVYQDLSCDAQGQLRSSLDARFPLEMDRVCDYIRGVCSLIR